MTDIFDVLDRAIDEFGRKRRSDAGSSREPNTAGTVTGTPNPLKRNPVPVIPAVPVANDDTSAEHPIRSTVEHRSAISPTESAPEVYPPLQNTGSTGTTGTLEDFRGSPGSRAPIPSGNYGKCPNTDSALHEDQISYLSEYGLFIDFETRSALELPEVGSCAYADHVSTEVWVACYAIGKGPVQAWYPGNPVPADLTEHVEAGRPLVAHNATFERTIWAKILTPQYGWPEPELSQWYCTAAMAAAMGLPRSLEGAALVTGCSFQKDMEGRRLILQMSRPVSAQACACVFCGAEPERARPPACFCGGGFDFRFQFNWQDDPESLKRGTEYCIRDVEAERELLTKLLPLPAFEREIWLLDQRINDRGIPVDLPMVNNAKAIVEQHLGRLNAELRDLTNGAVTAATQLPKLIAWLKDHGIELSTVGGTLGKEEVERLLARDDLPADCRRALKIRREASKTSTAKLDAYLRRTSRDDRLRETLLYQGAGRTGRWAGRGAQLQNLPRGGVEYPEFALEAIKQGFSAELFEAFVGPPLGAISGCLRQMLVAAPGCDLIGADYNAIEARGTAWLAGSKRMLEIFRRGEDPYRDMAAHIYGQPAESFTKTSRERQLGKIAVLGLGYQMGAERFRETCAQQGVEITADEAETIKRKYREANPEIVRLWKTLDSAAVRAVQDPGHWVNVANGKLGFLKRDQRLYLRLPSGRCLIYTNPKIELVDGPFGPRPGLTFEGVSSTSHRWERQTLYGGKLTENAVQAICRDLLAAALLRLEAADYPIVLHVHDEIVAEIPEDKGDLEEFEGLMAETPEWANGFPVKAEGRRAKRFGK